MERDIAAWKDYLRAHGELTDDDVVELEDHLRNVVAELQGGGLSDEEAFIIGVQRIGKVSSVAAEYSKANGRRLWKQLLVEPVDEAAGRRARNETLLVVMLALFAGLLSRLPEVFGIKLAGDGTLFYVRNLSFLILPTAVSYFIWKFSGRGLRAIVFFAVAACSAVLANVYPAYATGSFDVLIGIHVPILLWITAGSVYAGSSWRSPDGRMDFIRFSGETFIYLFLILCGGGVLIATADMLFQAIDIKADLILTEYVAVMGGCAAPVVAVYLAAAKRNIIENMAPVLARIFSPLFLVLLITFVVVMALTGSVLSVDRDILIIFDLLLVIVLAMVLYTISARDEKTGPGIGDYLQTGLIVFALIVDIIALIAIMDRIRDFGFTPNKVAALGENIILLVNLAVSAILYVRFLRTGEKFRLLTVWQTRFLPIIAVWAAVVAFLFPAIFERGY